MQLSRKRIQNDSDDDPGSWIQILTMNPGTQWRRCKKYLPKTCKN